MRLQTIQLVEKKKKYTIKSKVNLIVNKNKVKLNFFCLNPHLIGIKYDILSLDTFSIELKNPIKEKMILIYSVDMEYIPHNKNWRNNIHQTYKEKNTSILSLEENMKKMNKNIIYNFYDDKQVLQFLKTYTDDYIIDFYNTIQQFPLKIDFWRLIVLYIFGGWYLDIDISCLEPFNKIVDDRVEFLCPITTETNSMFNAVLYSKPQSNILMDCILMFLSLDMKNVVWKTGAFQSCFHMLYAIKKEIQPTDSQKQIPHILQQGLYNDGKVKIISEVCCGDSVYDYYCLDFGKKVFKSRIDNYDWITHKFIENDCLVND